MSADLLRNSLEIVYDHANTYLGNIDDRGEAWIILSNLAGHDGGVNIAARDKIVMSVCGIARETSANTGGTAFPSGTAAARREPIAIVAPPLYLEVRLMFLANFVERAYGDGLSALSRLIACFQQTPVLTHGTTPLLSPALDRLTLDFDTLGPADLAHVMSMHGARYLPSVFYRLRLLPFVSSAMRERGYPVRTTGAAASLV